MKSRTYIAGPPNSQPFTWAGILWTVGCIRWTDWRVHDEQIDDWPWWRIFIVGRLGRHRFGWLGGIMGKNDGGTLWVVIQGPMWRWRPTIRVIVSAIRVQTVTEKALRRL